MSTAPYNDAHPTKSRKTPAHLRKPQILALQAAGMTQEQIAAHFGVSRSTITTDLEELRPAKAQVETTLSQLVTSIDMLHSLEDSALNYVDLAKHAKNEAVRLATEDRIADFRGIVTEKERIRAKSAANSEVQPMFVLPQGCNLNVTVNRNTMNVTASNDDTSTVDTVSIDTTTPSKRDA